CYVVTPAGLSLLSARDGPQVPEPAGVGAIHAPARASPARDERHLRQARHDVHVAGWALALERIVGGARATLRGPEESVLAPPLRSTPDGSMALAPGDLRLPGGRTPHDFLRTDATGDSVEVERFATVRPDAIIETPAAGGTRPADAGGDEQGEASMTE